MANQSLPLAADQQQAPPKGRLVWLVGIVFVLLSGAMLRSYAATATVGDLLTWLPWLDQPTVTLYFLDETGTFFVPVTRAVTTNQDLPRIALEELRRGPKPGTSLRNVVPTNLALSALTLQDGIAHLDLAEASIATLDAKATMQMALALQKTLLALPGITQIDLTLAGRPLAALAENAASLADRPTALLYYVAGDYLVPVPFALKPEHSVLEQIVQAYLQGPSTTSTLVGLPPKTALLDLTFNQENGLVTVNFSYTQAVRELAIAEPEQMRLILTALIYTLTEIPGVKAVMLDFEGHSQLGLGQCRSLLRTPQLRSAVLNDERLIQ